MQVIVLAVLATTGAIAIMDGLVNVFNSAATEDDGVASGANNIVI